MVVLLVACAPGPPALDALRPAPTDTAGDGPALTLTPKTRGHPHLTLGPTELWSTAMNDVPEHHATVSFLPDGRLAVAWTWEHYSPQSLAYLRIVDEDGAPDAPPLLLAQGAHVAKPDVVTDGAGDLVVGYQATDRQALGIDRIDPALGEVVSTPLAEGRRASGNNSVALAALDDDSLVALWWSSAGVPGEPADNWFRRTVGDVAAAPVRVATVDDVGGPAAPDLDPVPGAGVAATWSDLSYRPGMDPAAVVALEVRRFEPGGSASVYRRAVYEAPDTFVVRPELAADAQGRVALVWANLRDASQRYPTTVSAMIACYDADGTELLPPTALSAAPADEPTVQFLDDATVAVAWNEASSPDRTAVALEILRFPTGRVLVPPTLLSDPAVSAERASLAARRDPDGGWVIGVSWEEHGEALPQREIRGRMAWYAP
ncbi:MAG: hypothetical protein R3F59_01230 [Myxococcota bacterium]